MTVAALFCMPSSVYRTIPGVDVFDANRDARSFDLAAPVVAHPPCRAWGRHAYRAKPREDERDLAHWAMHVVRHCGGVLEHPLDSKLWAEASCGTRGVRDGFGGALISVSQNWWGHRALKATGLYIVGPIPDMPPPVGSVSYVPVTNMGAAERMRTPRELAVWLVACARASQ